MAGKSSTYRGWAVLLLLIVIGGIIGGWLGETLTKIWPRLSTLGAVYKIGIPAFTINLHVFTVTFGFMLNVSGFTILGFIAAYLIYRRL
ncbi:MAG TPA: DUF4321 domain-containing protein [Syntrophomonadaceae bacterium]|nr:DUF4321 domain-containing protein [Syntrophomonadaceae bacterium]